ncbi:TAXI family TRAP transporter solute-binding subunit [Leucothrix sargassi]|nr:TAXI family TRAP transporter solute-binding subunit [Leucothrix sargassi]
MIRALFLLGLTLSATANAATDMPTGTEGSTYHAIGRDIAHIIIPYKLDIHLKPSYGSVDNIRQLLKAKGTDLSLAQSDVVAALKASTKSTTQAAINNLRLVLPLYQAEVHLLANKSVQHINDLNGKRVSVGRIGSGTHITATNILKKLDIKATPTHTLSPLDAYKELLLGKLDAVFFVSGKPIHYIQGMMEMNNADALKAYADGVHLVAIEDERLDETYNKASINPSDYVSLNGKHRLTNVSVPTVSVTTMLVTRNFPEDNTWETGMRCRQVEKAHRALRKRLPTLAAGGYGKNKYHPKWATVDFDAPVDLEKSRCINAKPATAQTKAAPQKQEASSPAVAVSAAPDKEAVELNASEVAEAHCLLTTGKPCSGS